MNSATDDGDRTAWSTDDLACAVVLHATTDRCVVYRDGVESEVGYAGPFASVSGAVHPGHLVAVTVRSPGETAVVWRWFDGLVLRTTEDAVSMWEPAHGEVTARRRFDDVSYDPGARAYLSAGLPGAEWWVAGRVCGDPGRARVDVAEVIAFYTDHDLWGHVAPSPT